MGEVRAKLRVTAGDRGSLGRHHPSSTPGAPGDRETTEAAIPFLHEELSELQTRLWAEGRRSLLVVLQALDAGGKEDRKSTRLNSSHGYISYAVFCLKKKKRINTHHDHTLLMSTACACI